MPEFDSLASLAAHVATVATSMRAAEHRALEAAARLVEETARSEVGSYQPAWGPYVEWAPLAASTEDAKARKGYPAGAPLLASGAMLDSFGREVQGSEAVVGSKDPKMVFHEIGTSKMPPRPVFGPALFRNKDAILALIGRMTVEGILEGRIASNALGIGVEASRISRG